MARHFLRIVVGLAMIGLLALPGRNAAGAAQLRKIDDKLLGELAGGGTAPAFILLSEQADTSFAALLPTKAEKGRAVVAALRAQARRDQPALLALLKQRGITGQPFLSINAISADIDMAAAELLAAQPGVAQIQADLGFKALESVSDEPAAALVPEVVEPGVLDINADDVWALGFTGQGVVVAGEDTGIRWTHDSLKASYRGWDGAAASHDYNWYDGIRTDVDGTTNPCGMAITEPCDDNSHGTHTVGTMVGLSGANQIGVAPGAKWIGCRNMDSGYGRIATYVRCIDWMIAPYPVSGTPEQGDPAKAPDIVNNSWGCVGAPDEDCDPAVIGAIQPSVRNAVNSGIMFVSSAGNNGSGCATILNPPAIYPESFSVGAYSPTTGNIASFSSRGPVTYDGATRIGPDISAPGVSTRSATIGSDASYGSKSGTSMASPHAAGAAALLWSARPELKGHVALSRAILQETARPTAAPAACGTLPESAGNNNTFGRGKIDALAAITATVSGTITIDGSAATTGTITVSPSGISLPLGANGTYSGVLPSGTYSITVTVPGHAAMTQRVTIVAGQQQRLDFAFSGTPQLSRKFFLPLVQR